MASGFNRDNAIEFVNAHPTPNTVACRTVKNGSVTETLVRIGHTVDQLTVYQIVAHPAEVNFFVDGKLVATHTTNIPAAPLNTYFGTSDDGAGNVPVVVDWVSFERAGN